MQTRDKAFSCSSSASASAQLRLLHGLHLPSNVYDRNSEREINARRVQDGLRIATLSPPRPQHPGSENDIRTGCTMRIVKTCRRRAKQIRGNGGSGLIQLSLRKDPLAIDGLHTAISAQLPPSGHQEDRGTPGHSGTRCTGDHPQALMSIRPFTRRRKRIPL